MAQKNAQPAITTEEHIPSTEHGKGFPPFDSSTFASQLLWLVITFVALYLLMSRVALPRVGAIIENRQKRIAGDLAEAQGMKDQSDAAIAAYEKALAEARGRAQALANETREKQAAAAEAAPQDARRQAQCPHRRSGEDHRGEPVRGDGQCSQHRGGCRRRDRRAADRCRAGEQRCVQPPSATCSSAEESDVRSRILGRRLLRAFRRRARLFRRAQDDDEGHRRPAGPHQGRARRGAPAQGGGASAAGAV